MKHNSEKKGFTDYANLEELSERNKQTIVKAKKEREQHGGEHHHKEQCDGIPETLDEIDRVEIHPYSSWPINWAV